MEISSKVGTQKGLFKAFFPMLFPTNTDLCLGLGTNISPFKGSLKMIFLFPRWDMLVPWRVNQYASPWYILETLGKTMEALDAHASQMPGGWRRTLALLAGQLM